MSEPDFGTDLSCGDDLTPTMTMVSGMQLLLEAVQRRLSTPRGTLIDAPDYGFDLAEVLSDAMTEAEIRAIPRRIELELEKDDRIDSARARVILQTSDTLQVAIDVFTSFGPFRFTASVADASVLVTERVA